MSFEEFKDVRHGGHLGYWYGMILAFLNLCDASHQVYLNLTYGLGGDVF